MRSSKINKVESLNKELSTDEKFDDVQQETSSKTRKIAWIIVITVSLCGLGYYVKDCYIKLRISPEILVNERYVRRDEIPFPAITICPPYVISSTFINAKEFSTAVSQNKTPNQEDQVTMAALGQICGRYYRDLTQIEGSKDFNEDVTQILNKVAPQISEVFSKCLTHDIQGCEKIFLRSLTFIGYCFTFNMDEYQSIFNEQISSDFDVYKSLQMESNNFPKWSLEDGYATNVKFIKPLRSTEVEFLQVKAAINKIESQNFCTGRLDSFQVYVHPPNEIPSHMHLSTFFELKKHKYLKITASIKSMDKSLNNYPIDKRNCFFKGEKQLKFFKSYTMSNCVQECMSNFTFMECKCSLFSAPREDGQKVCKFEDVPCFSAVYNKWPSNYYENAENVLNYPDFPCNCMPVCREIKYQFVNEHSFDMKNFESDSTFYAQIKIIFSYSGIIETTNYVTYQLESFVSDIGGLAGLFLGLSFITVFEMVLKILEFMKKIIIKPINKIKDDENRQYSEHTSKIDSNDVENISVNQKTNLYFIEISHDDELTRNIEWSSREKNILKKKAFLGPSRRGF